MASAILIGRQVAVCRDYVWEAGEPVVARLLNARRDKDGPAGCDPDPDFSLAQDAVAELAACLLWNDEGDDDPDA